jgi:hypothetical protein
MSQRCTSNTNCQVATLSSDAPFLQHLAGWDRWPVYSIDDRQLAVIVRTSK